MQNRLTITTTIAAVLLLSGCTSIDSRIDHYRAKRMAYFGAHTFIGVPISVSEEAYQGVHGKFQAVRVKVVKDLIGKTKEEIVSYGIIEGTDPGLEFGETYRFTLMATRHGMELYEARKIKKAYQGASHNGGKPPRES